MKNRVSDTTIKLATPQQRIDGLIGYVSFLLNDKIRFDGVTLRKNLDGEYYLSYPARRDGKGREHPLVHPIDHESRKEIEQQVFDDLGFSEVLNIAGLD